jgi:SAM-dependent methyltransferase
MLETIGRRFARVATDAVVRRPRLWWLFRGPLRKQFDLLAPRWNTMRSPDHLAPFEAALAAVDQPPRRALDIGTGTGAGAVAIARRFPGTEVVGIDLSEAMLAEARRTLPAELASRVRYEGGDASRLPYDDSAFDLLALANMIPFFDELTRVLAPGGSVVFGFSGGAGTPIYVPPERLRMELERRGFADFAEFEAGAGTAFLARKAARG